MREAAQPLRSPQLLAGSFFGLENLLQTREIYRVASVSRTVHIRSSILSTIKCARLKMGRYKDDEDYGSGHDYRSAAGRRKALARAV